MNEWSVSKTLFHHKKLLIEQTKAVRTILISLCVLGLEIDIMDIGIRLLHLGQIVCPLFPYWALIPKFYKPFLMRKTSNKSHLIEAWLFSVLLLWQLWFPKRLLRNKRPLLWNLHQVVKATRPRLNLEMCVPTPSPSTLLPNSHVLVNCAE